MVVIGLGLAGVVLGGLLALMVLPCAIVYGLAKGFRDARRAR